MPRYDYKCDSCKKKYELQQSFSAEASHRCEKCAIGTATRVLSIPTVVFKGSGFYVNDKGGKNHTASDKELKGRDSKFDSKESAEQKAETKNTPAKEKAKSSSTSTGKRSKSKAS